jgi:hypothetical protein
MTHFVQEVVEWLRGALGWIVISLAAGTLFALRRGATGLRSWVAVLAKSCIVGVLAGPVIQGTEWQPGWQAVAIAAIAFGADTVLYLADRFWSAAARDPAGTARAVLRWFAGRGVDLHEAPRQPPTPMPRPRDPEDLP